MEDSLLDVRDLSVCFDTDRGAIGAVDGVSLSVPRGKTVALVGESGCGKSVTALSILRLIPQPPGRIQGGQVLFTPPNPSPERERRVQRVDLLDLSDHQMQSVRGGRIAMIFQDPLTSLNPVFSIGEQIVEAIELHRPMRGKVAWEEAARLLDRVGFPDPARRIHDYPHQLSGGMCQRVMIAMALACEPALLIADEPTTALDVTIQSEILDLLKQLQRETGMGMLFITHDLGVVARIADYVYVMYAGRIVEHAATQHLLRNALHPYTQGLLRCTPRMADHRNRLEFIPGQVPDPANPPSGCRFHPRCALSAQRAGQANRNALNIRTDVGKAVLRRCVETFDDEPSGQPPLREIKPDHFVACWEVGC